MTPLRRWATVALFSAAALTYEILLVRAFAIEHFHHFAYMAISVAMLGFGASGTSLALAGRLRPETAERLFTWTGPCAVIALVVCPALADLVELDATQLAWDPGQWPRLAVVYLLMAVPFGATALVILLGITLEHRRPGAVYGASFVGSGLGSGFAVVVLGLVLPDRALATPALLAAAGALICTRRRGASRLAGAAGWATAALSVAVLVRPVWTLDVSQYKGLPQVEAFPDARRVAEYASPLGWVVAVEAPAQRYAPGLSLRYEGAFPRQTGIFVDGELTSALVRPDAGEETSAFVDWIPTALPFAMGDRRRVLILGAGGGSEVFSAAAHGAESVVAVEIHPDVVRLAEKIETGRTVVHWIVGDARRYVVQTDQQFDLITLGSVGGFGAAAAGLHALGADFLHTVDAYVDYLHRLAPGGVLAITRWISVPPRETVRMVLTAADALRRVAPGTARDGLFVARSWATVTVMAKPAGFTAGEVDALNSWAQQREFDVDWHGGLEQPTSHFHLLEEPVLFAAATAGTSGRRTAARFAAEYPFDVRPVSDARPYPHHFLRPGAVGAFIQSNRGTWLPFAEWGFVALIATLAQSVVLAALLTLGPAVLATRRTRSAFSVSLAGYFGAIGLAYLAAEVAVIHQLSLWLGHPVYAVAAGLAVFLIGSGAGSAWSDRLEVQRGWFAPAAAGVLLLLFAAVLLQLGHLLQPMPFPIRAVAGIAVVGPLAFVMGLPFPMGLRLLARGETTRIAWAWATNGFASVVAAPLAALIALELGSPAVFVMAAMSYAGAMLIQRQASLGSPSAFVDGDRDR